MIGMAELVGSAMARRRSEPIRQLDANLAAVRPLDEAASRRRLRRAYASYARYWAETLKMPDLSAETIAAGMRVTGYHHIETAREAGSGPILVLPHLGGWEWAAAYLGRVTHVPVTAVVERLHPDDLFEWFMDLRSSYGVTVVPLGPDALGALVRAVRNRDVVCLLSDRDIAGGGVEVRFFGRSTTMPVGPALLARRTGAPIHPAAVYFESERDGSRIGHHCVIDHPIEVAVSGSLRADVAVTTQRIAEALERLIERAPEQWHVLEPIFS
jgi:KDO2-lipid IV(A) lauroyltransferase